MSVLRFFLYSLLFSWGAISNAHQLAPASLNITQLTEPDSINDYKVSWKESNKRAKNVTLAPIFPDFCDKKTQPTFNYQETSIVYDWVIKCDVELRGQRITFNDLSKSRVPVLVNFTDSAIDVSALVSPDMQSWLVPEEVSLNVLLIDYIQSGIIHMALGWDHVVFVLALCILLRGRIKLLLIAASFFTIGHSLSLLLVATEKIVVPGEWVEWLIAATIVYMTLEIILPQLKSKSFSISNRPYLLSVLFGLIHGCGFAGILLEASIPARHLISSVLSFNVGVEIAQILLITLYLLLARISLASLKPYMDTAQLILKIHFALAYSFGVLGSYWLISRTVIVINSFS